MKAGILFRARDIHGVSSPGTRGYKSVKVAKMVSIIATFTKTFSHRCPDQMPMRQKNF